MTTSAKKLFKEWQNDPEYRREYDALEEEFSRAKSLIAARAAAGLTQAQVAKRTGTAMPCTSDYATIDLWWE